MEPGRIWYGAYGSNLCAERFGRYLTGGVMPGTSLDHRGARDSTPARRWVVAHAPHRLCFGHHSSRWGGGVAFLDPRLGSGRAVLRCWDLTGEQFVDVAAQENGMTPGELEIDLEELTERGSLEISDRWYGRALVVGGIEGAPVVTFTSGEPVAPNPPEEAYLAVVVTGLVESGAASDEDAAVEYLLAVDGLARRWPRPRLAELVRSIVER